VTDFVLKFTNFRYHGNRVNLTNFTYTVKLADPKNPYFGARITDVSQLQTKS